MGYPVMWFDLGATDIQPLKRFYGELFGWELQDAAETYTRIDTKAGSGIPGGIGRSGTGDPWIAFYVEADDPQALLEKAESMGAKTVLPVTELPAVTFAMFNDPDGLLIGLIKPMRGATEPSAGDGEAVDWFEVIGTDAGRTQSFYRELFGWQVDDVPGYAMVDTAAGRGAAGGIGGSSDHDENWATVYARVDDVETYLQKAEQLGGKRVYGPREVGENTTTGAFRDPVDNVFGLYHYSDS
jgi:predicted enzyme related to lactoylglutathione lyase